MKTLVQNSILLSILLFVFCLCYQKLFWLACGIVCWIWYSKVRGKSVILVALLLGCICLPRYSSNMPTMHTASARHVNGSYAILENHNEKILVYTQQPLYIDAQYAILQDGEKIESSSHFYAFDFAHWANQQGVYYSVKEENIKCIKENHTLRRCIQKQIEKIADLDKKAMAYKVLLNIRTQETKEDWLYENGFSYAGILLGLQWILKYFLTREKRDTILWCLTFLLCIIYRFPLLLVQSLLYRTSKIFGIHAYQSIGCITTILLCLYPHQVLSAAFLIPTIYRYSSILFEQEKKMGTFFLVLLVQGFLFQNMNPIKNVLYPTIQLCNGFLYIFCFLELFLPLSFSQGIAFGMQSILAFCEKFTLEGSLLGVGFVFFLCIFKMLYQKKHRFFFASIVLLFFQWSGAFHPCCEMSVINVGQGDAILLRAPFNTENILIDTGKPTAWDSLDTFLKAKQIHTIHTMIITHDDDDHSGNAISINENYVVDNIVTTHLTSIPTQHFTMYDINPIDNEDANQSAIVNTFYLNGKNVCLMADADTTSESEILKKYPNLHCDILKVGHHGSKTSTSDTFLDKVQPTLALISSGPYYIYHHPSEETLQKFLKRHIPYFDTKTSGDMTILCFFKIRLFITSSFDIGLL